MSIISWRPITCQAIRSSRAGPLLPEGCPARLCRLSSLHAKSTLCLLPAATLGSIHRLQAGPGAQGVWGLGGSPKWKVPADVAGSTRHLVNRATHKRSPLRRGACAAAWPEPLCGFTKALTEGSLAALLGNQGTLRAATWRCPTMV